MSVTIFELLKLPSLREAKVIAGAAGIHRIVSGISVLENADPVILKDRSFNDSQFYGSELAITSFINVREDIPLQCSWIRRLQDVGEVGLIIYYVGVILPCVAPELIALANALDFPLICMPEGRKNLRYSEVIYEVMEAIIEDNRQDAYLVGEFLERIALLPPHQRSMDAVLGMLRDRTTSSFFLLGADHAILHMAAWPTSDTATLDDLLAACDKDPTRLPSEPGSRTLPGVSCAAIQNDGVLPMYLIAIKEPQGLTPELWHQATEVVQLFINIWSRKHSHMGTEELINAILKDEPVKMRRLADFLHIDVAALHHMLLIFPAEILDTPEKRQQFNHRLLKRLPSLASDHYTTSLTGIYNQVLVCFTGDTKIAGANDDVLTAIRTELEATAGEQVLLVSHAGLKDTADVRRVYITSTHHIKETRSVFPDKNRITFSEIRFIKSCQQSIDEGEESLGEILALLDPLTARDACHGHELLSTLTVFLLDADLRMATTSEKLFLHINTVKYRIRKLGELFGFKIGKMPETAELYRAVATYRLLEALKNQEPNA